jgi:hypothetical protein
MVGCTLVVVFIRIIGKYQHYFLKLKVITSLLVWLAPATIRKVRTEGSNHQFGMFGSSLAKLSRLKPYIYGSNSLPLMAEIEI